MKKLHTYLDENFFISRTQFHVHFSAVFHRTDVCAKNGFRRANVSIRDCGAVEARDAFRATFVCAKNIRKASCETFSGNQ